MLAPLIEDISNYEQGSAFVHLEIVSASILDLNLLCAVGFL